MKATFVLPDTIPVFPLSGALLLPGGRLPLRVFEPRYLQMTDDALRGNRLMGIIQPMTDEGPSPKLYSIGCVGRLCAWSESGDGRYSIALAGLSRFRVDQELQSARQYRIVKADYADFESDIHADDSGDTIDRERLAQCVRQYFARQQMENLWPSVEEFPGDLLVNSLSMVCPFPPAEKQALLEAPTIADRAAMLIALIEMSMADSQGPEGMLQ